jgi:histidine ammonia-lyase
MAGAAALLFNQAEQLLLTADVVAAMSLEALRGTRTAFDLRIHKCRPHPGQLACAERLSRLTAGSQIIESHRGYGKAHEKVQDAYSLRCIPQVHGAVADAIAYLGRVLAIELNAATDNPLVFPEGDAVLSGGNFHGEPLALALDFAAIALAGLGSISERRLFRLLTGHLSDLPAFLTRHSGVDNGYMLIQYTAAALAADNQMLAAPASVHSLPTSADQEDHNSMGWHAALKGLKVLANVQVIVGLEAVAAAQGIDLLAPLEPAPGVAAAHRTLRERIPPLEHDRNLEPEVEAAIDLVRSGKLAEPARNLGVARPA